ncbi:MAG: tetratricopeptide repeat protein [Myxococcaceae bacterium]|nr:tetratricopeptide repeat protein [Myxococcaceae bacterium]
MTPHLPLSRASFSAHLYRPYLDLGPADPAAPFHVLGLDFAIRALGENRPYPRIQSALNPSFREQLLQHTALPMYRVTAPRDLAPALRTPRWAVLVESVDAFTDLEPAQQVRLSWLLGKLCLQHCLLELLPRDVETRASRSGHDASLAYLRALARYRLQLDDPRQPYSLGEFERVANEAPPGIARVDAHYQMVVQSVKHKNDVAAVERWQALHRRAIETSAHELDAFEQGLVMSRYHRVGGFVPQMRKDRQGTVEEMELAERHARALPTDTAEHRTAALEMLYPVIESRTKEALWLGDKDLALERARTLTTLSAHDPRAWLHLGQVYVDREELELAADAYRRSARYSPPGREVALFMLGQCLEELGQLEAARDAYVGSLDVDPLGVSAAESLLQLAERLDERPLARWAKAHLEQLSAHRAVAVPRAPEPYKNLPAPTELGARA